MNIETLSLLDRRVPRYTSYPTAPHFTPEIDGECYRAWLSALPAARPISLYIHVPFCASLCWYCGCNTQVVRRSSVIDEYLEHLSQEIDLILAAIGRRPRVAYLHFGGGTPNHLDALQMRRMWRLVERSFDLTPDVEISMELDPRLLTNDQAVLLAELGVTRASLGIQDFDPHVQKAVNRVQPFDLVAEAVRSLRRVGIGRINFDLLFGLPEQTVETVIHTAALAASLNPDRIALFGYAHVPWMKPQQMKIDERDLPSSIDRVLQEQAAAMRLVAGGYARIGLDHFAKPNDALAIAQRSGKLRRNFQGYSTDQCETLIGLGPSSISSLPQGYIQNHAEPVLHRAMLHEGKLPIIKGWALSEEDRARREIIERLMCTLKVDLDDIASIYDSSFVPNDFAEIDALAEQGTCHREGHKITVPEANRPLVRLVCGAFDRYLGTGKARHSLAV